jgi:hypothetical protein
MTAVSQRRRRILIALLKLQGLVGLGFLLWIFFAGERADDPAVAARRLEIDATAMALDSLNIVTQKHYDLIVIKPSPQILQQLADVSIPLKTTSAEPPQRDYRISAAIKVFALARIEDHYLLSGRDHWQRDQVCDELQLQRDFAVAGQTLAAALVCRQLGRSLVYDIAGRSLQPDIADLEMPSYRLQDDHVVISNQ